MSMILSTYHVRFRPGATDVETANVEGYRLEGWSNDYVIFGPDQEPRFIYPREIVQSIDRVPYEDQSDPHGSRPYWQDLEHCCQVLRNWIDEDLTRFVSLEKLWRGFEEIEDDATAALDASKEKVNVSVVETGIEPSEPPKPIKRGRLYLYSEENKYTISFRPSEQRSDGSFDGGYLGGGVSRRKARAGEDWTRGRDLADGPMEYDTWKKIVSDMLAFELIEPTAKEVPKVLPPTPEQEAFESELGAHRGETTSP